MKDGFYSSRFFNCDCYVHVEKYDYPYGDCEGCGQPISTIYHVEPESDGLDYWFGPKCVKKLGLKRNDRLNRFRWEDGDIELIIPEGGEDNA